MFVCAMFIDQKIASNHLELALQNYYELPHGMGTEIRSCTRAPSALNY